MDDLKGMKVLLVAAAKEFRDEEFFEPFNLLRERSASVTVASSIKGAIYGSYGKNAVSDVEISECRAEDFDAVIFVGGAGAVAFFEDSLAHSLARSALEQGKILAAICSAPVILANAGLLKGKLATSFKSFEKCLAARGAVLAGKSVVRDGRLLTADGPGAASKFALELVKMLGKKQCVGN